MTDAFFPNTEGKYGGATYTGQKSAEERRITREQALEWTGEVQMEDDEEQERKSKRSSKNVKGEADEGPGPVTPSERKKRRRGS